MKWGRKKEATTINNEPITKKPSTFSLTNLSSWLSKLKPHHKCTTPKHPPPPAPAPTPTPSPTHPPIPRRLSASDADPPPTRLATHTRPHSFGSELEFPLPSPSPARRPRRRKPSTDLKPIKTGPVSGTGTTPDPIRPGRRSFNGGRIRPRVRVCSPRLAHSNPVVKERAGVGLERYAVVKSSVDPTSDFRESMVEMIWEKGIGQPEELERLLACYLALNSEEHHDLIVKVFRQVWFDLSREIR